MNRRQLDEMYHLLRELNTSGDMVQQEAIAGIVSHLTTPKGDYTGLLRFLTYYAEKYELPDVLKFAHKNIDMDSVTGIIELGAGFGWLARGLSSEFNNKSFNLVDKRQWVGIDIVADIESTNGIKRVLDFLNPNDLIVMSEFLHCLPDPKLVMDKFAKWPLLVIEYMPENQRHNDSFIAQLTNFGHPEMASIGDIFPDRQIISASLGGTHNIYYICPKEGISDKA